MKPRIYLVGENNPYGPDPYYALYPDPPTSAGGRLCFKILGMTEEVYLSTFERRNLLSLRSWSAPKAREAAAQFRSTVFASSDRVILFGRKVSSAFFPDTSFPLQFFERRDIFLSLPHPSGLCRLWAEPGTFEKAREAIRSFMLPMPWPEAA